MQQLKLRVRFPIYSKNSDAKCANYAKFGRPSEWI